MNEHLEVPSGNAPAKQATMDDYESNKNNTNIPYGPSNSQEKLRQRYEEVDIKNKFNPYRFRNNIEPYMGGIPIIFMTTPQMNIFENSNSNDSKLGNIVGGAASLLSKATNLGTPSVLSNTINSAFSSAKDAYENDGQRTIPDQLCKTLQESSDIFSFYQGTDPDLLKALTYGESVGGTKSPWIKFLTNLFKGISLSDFTMRTAEEYETYYGWKQILPGPLTDSFSANNFSVNFEETKNLDVIKFHYLWMTYIEAVRYGTHTPSNQMRNRRTIDYTSSLYYFVLDFDMSKILYYCKYTGIYPISVPISVLATGDINTKGTIDVNITYAYQYKTELQPSIIYDFNSIAKFAYKVVGYGRASMLTDNVDSKSSAEDLKEQYGYGNISTAKNGKFGLDFSDPDLRSFDNVEIKLLNNQSYDTKNKTAFSSDTNLSRKSFHMFFNNGSDEKYGENYETADIISQDVNDKWWENIFDDDEEAGRLEGSLNKFLDVITDGI